MDNTKHLVLGDFDDERELDLLSRAKKEYRAIYLDEFA